MDQFSENGQLQWDRLAGSTLTIQALPGTPGDHYDPGHQMAVQVLAMSQPDGSLSDQAILSQLTSQSGVGTVSSAGTLDQTPLQALPQQQQQVPDKYNSQLTGIQASTAEEISVTPVINLSPAIQNTAMRSILKSVAVPQTFVPTQQASYTDIQTNLGPGEQIFEMGQEKEVTLEQAYLETKMGGASQAVVTDNTVEQAFLAGDRNRDKLFNNDDIFSQENMDSIEQSEAEFHLQEQQQQLSSDHALFDDSASQKKATNVFVNITAQLSQDVQNLLPVDKQSYLDQLQSSFSLDLFIEAGDGSISISGSLHSIVSAYKHLNLLIHSPQISDDLPPVCDKEIQTIRSGDIHTKNKSIVCDLLVPAISIYGREIKHPSRYLGYLNLPSSMSTGMELQNQEDDDDDDDDDVRPSQKSVRRKRKPGRPRKLHPARAARSTSKTVSDAPIVDAENAGSDETKSGLMGLSAPPGGTAEPTVTCDGGQPLLSDSIGQFLTDTESNTTAILDSQSGDLLASKPDSAWEGKLDPIDSSTGRKKGKGPQTRSQMIRKQYENLAPFKFFCNHCSFKSKRESHYIRHNKLHESNKDLYSCKFCSFKTIRYSTLRRHEIAHCSFAFECDECPYKTDSATLLSKHINLKHVEKAKRKKAAEKLVYSCAVCDYNTVSTAHYRRHLRAHGHEVVGFESKLPSFLCDKCDYKTTRKEHFVRHMNDVHSQKRPYLCDLCGRGFKRSDALAQHMITHVDKAKRSYAFQCPICTKGFRSRAHMNEHMSMHSSARTYLCHICGAAFKTRNVQRKHLQTIHMNPRSFNCPLCEKRFNTKYALKRHKQTHDVPAGAMTEEGELAVTHTQISEIEAQALQTIRTSQADLVQDVIPVAIDETYDQSSDSMRQTYIQSSEATTALLYLTSSLNTTF